MEVDSTDSTAEDIADTETVEAEAGSVAVRHCPRWVTPIAPLASSQSQRRQRRRRFCLWTFFLCPFAFCRPARILGDCFGCY